MTDTMNDILESFSMLDDWEDRYRYVIELGRELPPYPEEARDEADAHIVRGLVYILITFYSGKHASEVRDADIEKILKKLGLDENLTPQRSNGLRSMVERIRLEARNTLQKQ